MEANQKYSVLMSVYEKEKPTYLRASIESMLHQTIPPSDFVLMCDGPLTDGLDAVIDDMQNQYPQLFQVIRIPVCQGLGHALAAGVPVCRYDRIARMDSDDISNDRRCELELAAMEEKHADIVGSNIVEFEGSPQNQKFVRAVPEKQEEILIRGRRRNPFNHPSVMFQKSAVLSAGNYLDCKGFEDYYLWARMLKNGAVGYNIQQNLVYMRTDEGMYDRRGSVSYAWQALRARWRIKKTGFSSLSDFLISGMGQLAVSLMPVEIRRKMYQKLLRKKNS